MELAQTSKKYKSTHSLVYSCQYHVIFCPNFRRKVLVDGVDTRLKELILEKQNDYGYKVLDMEVMSDHVYLLLDIDPRLSVFKVVRAN
jgi:putative transposase